MSVPLDSFNQISLEICPAMTKSEYDKVIFHDVSDCYMTDADVECRYTLTSSIVPSKKDRVALFKVGWEDTHQYIKYEWIALPEDVEYTGEMSILFKAQDLPKDDGEYYQFCYITADGYVRGASTPFKFRRPTDDDLVEVEDDDNDLMIIRSRTAVIEDRLRGVAVQNHELQKAKAVLEIKLAAKEQLCTDTEKKLIALEGDLIRFRNEMVVQVETKDEERKQLLQELKDAQVNSDKQKSEVQNVLVQNEAYINELRETVKVLSEQKEGLVKQLGNELKETANLRKQLSETDNRLKAFVQKSEQLSKELAVQRETGRQLQSQIKVLEGSLRDEQKNDADLKVQLQDIEKERNHLQMQLLDTEHMLAAMEKSKHLATEELMAHADSRQKMLTELEKVRANFDVFQEKFRLLDGDHKKQLERNSNLEKEYESLSEKYQVLQKNGEENAAFKKQSVGNETVLKALIDDLTVRLKTGAAEYQAKYIECLKLQKKLAKLKQKYKDKLHVESKEENKTKSEGDVPHSCETSTTSEDKTSPRLILQNQQQLELYEVVIAEKDRIISNLDCEIQKLKIQADGIIKQSENKSRKCISSPAATSKHQDGIENQITERSRLVEQEATRVKEPPRTSSMIDRYRNPPYPYPPIYPLPKNPFVCESDGHFSTSSSSPSATRQKPVVIIHMNENVNVLENEQGIKIPLDQTETLPKPIEPKVTADAKVAAIIAMTRNMDKLPSELGSRNGLGCDNTNDDLSRIPDGASAPQIEQADHFACPLCPVYFTPPYDFQAMQTHMDSHFNLECPLCSRLYESNAQKKFEAHVQSHFEDERKPQAAREQCNPFRDLAFD